MNYNLHIKKNFKTLLIFTISGFFAAIPLSLVLLFVELPEIERRIIQNKKANIQIAVESVFNILEYYHEQESNGLIATAEAKIMAAKTIEKLKYQKEEYFWIHSLELKMIMHPAKPSLNGTDISKNTDPNGKFLFREMNELVNKDGEGIIKYLWPKPGKDKPIPKFSFVKLFKPWGWVLGSGAYIDDIEEELSQTTRTSTIWLIIGTGLAMLISLISGIRLLITLIVPVQNIVRNLSTEANTLLKTASILTQSSSALKSSGDSQSAAIHETASAMTEMNEMIAKTANSAENSSNFANKTQELSLSGLSSLEALNETVTNITKLQEKLQIDLNDSLNQLNEIITIMNSVSSKTDVINDIVFQTKLLSFNASVEAARAGEAGKGFSVVAEEIGKLAQMSGISAIEIYNIVKESKTKVSAITDQIKLKLGETISEVNESVQIGLEKSNSSLVMLKEVVEISSKSSEMSRSITAANKEQSIGSQEATEALRSMEQSNHELSEIVTTTEKVGNEILSISQSLENISKDLSTVVDK
jgi:methyl-accepting chemotaxis protein